MDNAIQHRTDEYAENWKNTFDWKFLWGWIIAVAVLLIISCCCQRQLFLDYGFFSFCLIKVAVMCLIGTAGGLLCRHFCRADEYGYIIDKSHDWFKVNYTRKLQHFAAYLVPLLTPFAHAKGILPHIWESILVMLAFLLLIKPIRERSTFFMLQFNAMDRPEDRPNTLKWIILGNLLPALLLGIVSQEIFETVYGKPKLALLIILIIGIGDGLAEPVGIHWGRKKYTVPAWNFKKRYIRSYVGSACVWICSLIFTACFYTVFDNWNQFLAALLILPPVMTFAEAYAPHSMDTPVMMILGAGVLMACCCL